MHGLAAVAAHFNGKSWLKVAAPPLPRTAADATLDGIVAVRRDGRDRLWLSGNWQPCSLLGNPCANHPFVVKGSGGRWTSEPLPTGVTAVDGLSPGRSGRPQWMTATTSNMRSSHYLRHTYGAWVLVPGVTIAGQFSPGMRVVHVPGTNASWAVGSASDGPLISSFAPRIELNGDLP